MNEPTSLAEKPTMSQRLQPSLITQGSSQQRRKDPPASRPSQKARAAAATAGRTYQATLDRYSLVSGRQRDNGWGDRARRQTPELQNDNDSDAHTSLT